MHYRERLRPKWWVFILLGALIAMLSIAYGAAISATVGWVMFLVIAGLVFVGITTSAPIIEVTDVVRVDAARLPVKFIDQVTALDAAATREARRSRDRALDFVLVKMWSSTTAVAFTVTDESDPHTGWLISTRHPVELKSAIEIAQAASGTEPRTSDTVGT
ncbi:MAG: DUF3093 domain-containing protein [Candidatus Nanopelagicales bacterium]